MLNSIIENCLVSRLAAHLPRSPIQVNGLHEADAEILAIPGMGETRLALTTDTLAEEIASCLYSDPWLIGWMTVMANLSDLAAVGAKPLGLLVAETLPPSASEPFLTRLQQGISDACNACGTYVLGGDTNSGQELAMNACAIGIIEGGRTITRIGCSSGEAVFVSGPLGDGSAYAFAKLNGDTPPPYRPVARVREGSLLRSHASCCMDTSDGLLAALDQLMRLNNVGFALESGWQLALTEISRGFARELDVPDWLVLAGEHGEFELVFTIPEDAVRGMLVRADSIGWHPLRIGRVTSQPRITVPAENGTLQLDTAAIRNCSGIARRDVGEYLLALRALAGGAKIATES